MATKSQAGAGLYAVASRYEQKEISFRESVAEASQLLMEAVECARLRIWHFEVGGELQGMRCSWAKHRDEPLVDDAELITAPAYTSYFTELAINGYFVSNDVESD